MSIDKISDNRVVTGSDGGRAAANLNYILYLIGVFTGITALVGVVLAYSNRHTASAEIRSHFDWQIKIFWRSVKFLTVIAVLYFIFSIIAVVTLGLGLILDLIPFGIWIWWAVSTIARILRGMKALGLGQPVALAAGSAGSVPLLAAAAAPAAPVASMAAKGWYDDAERPGHKRWWDGTAWGIRDEEHSSRASGTSSTDAGDDNGAQVASGSPTPAVAAVPTDDSEIAVTTAVSTPETLQAPVVTATAIAPDLETATADTTASPEPDPAPPTARFCENCGAERRPGGRFCTSCGHA